MTEHSGDDLLAPFREGCVDDNTTWEEGGIQILGNTHGNDLTQQYNASTGSWTCDVIYKINAQRCLSLGEFEEWLELIHWPLI